MLPNDRMNPLFAATVQATEEAIVNAMVAAETMTGANGYTVKALPHDELRRMLKKYNRLVRAVVRSMASSLGGLRLANCDCRLSRNLSAGITITNPNTNHFRPPRNCAHAFQ